MITIKVNAVLPLVKAAKDCAAADYSKVKVKLSGFLVEYTAGAYPCFNGVKPLRSCHSLWTGRQSDPGHLPNLMAGTHLQLRRLKQ